MVNDRLLQTLSFEEGGSEGLQLIQASQHIGLSIADPSGPDAPLVYVTEGFENLTGFMREEVIGQSCKFLQGPGTHASTIAEIGAAIREHRRYSGVLLNYRKDRSPFWNELTLLPARSRAGAPFVVGLQVDVSAQMRRRAYDAQQSNHGGLAAGFLTWFPQRNEYHPSKELYEILGVDPAAFVPGVSSIASLFPPDQAHTLAKAWADGCNGRARHNIEACSTIGDIIRYLRIDVKPILRDDGVLERVVMTFEDSSRGLANERRLRLLAYHDQLTGLVNRMAFVEHFEMTAGRYGGAVLVLGLKHLREVGDAFGHDVSDQALRLLAERLKHVARGNDIVARLEGDEFGIMLRGGIQEGDARQLASRLIRHVCEPVELDGRRFQLGAAVGFALVADDASEAQDALSKAYLALSDASGQGSGSVVRYSPTFRARAEARRALAQRLRAALRKRQITVFYQPQIDFATGQVHGFETLVRWREADGSFVPPSDFIPVAEDEGLIGEIGALVVRKALAQARRWLERGLNPGVIAVNVAADQIRNEDFPSWIIGQLEKHGVAPSRLAIELTENIFVDRYADVILSNLRRISEAGIKISLDDFGTGWATLTHLRRFPLDTIKIDRSFVWKLESNPDDAAICRAIIGLAHNLGMQVTAEGLETPFQMEAIKAMACDHGQGYFIARPLPGPEATRWLLSASACISESDNETGRDRPAAAVQSRQNEAA